MLRRLEALLAVADTETSFIVSGTGDVIEPDDGLIGIGSGGPYALAAARALVAHTELDAPRRSLSEAMRIAAGDLHLHQRSDRGRGAVTPADRPAGLTPAQIVAELDRYIVGQGGQAGGGHRAAQPLAAPEAARRSCATRSRRRTSS